MNLKPGSLHRLAVTSFSLFRTVGKCLRPARPPVLLSTIGLHLCDPTRLSQTFHGKKEHKVLPEGSQMEVDLKAQDASSLLPECPICLDILGASEGPVSLPCSMFLRSQQQHSTPKSAFFV